MICLKSFSAVANIRMSTIGSIVDELEYRLPEEVVRLHFAEIAKQIYQRKVKRIWIIWEIEKEMPKLYAVTEMNIFERNKTEF